MCVSTWLDKLTKKCTSYPKTDTILKTLIFGLKTEDEAIDKRKKSNADDPVNDVRNVIKKTKW